MDKRNHELEKAGLSIPEILAKNRLLVPYKVYQAKLNWADIVGKQIAKYSYVKDFYKNLLIVGVLNPVWMNQLFMYKQEIIHNINAYLGEEIIHDIRFIKSGKKPPKVVYETLDGTENEDLPHVPIKQIVIPTADVEKIRHETKALPKGLQEKVTHLRFAQRKRQLAYETSGFQRCPTCGRWLSKGESQCLVCRLKVRQEQKKQVYDILQDMPWLTWDEVLQDGRILVGKAVYEELYNEVRRDLIYKCIEKIYHDYDAPADDLVLAMLITRKKPGELTDDFIRNLTATYRSKEDHVSTHREESSHSDSGHCSPVQSPSDTRF